MNPLEPGASSLDGAVAIVTGGNGGIGLGMVEGLLRAGAYVAIWARNQEKSAIVLDRLRTFVGDDRVAGFACDVSDPAQVADAMALTIERFDRLDVCIANAGFSEGASILDLTLDSWRRVTAVNLDGVFLTLQSAAREMVDRGHGGALVAVSSTSAYQGAPLNAHYAASKAGVLALSRSMAVGLAKYNIRVNALVPGWVTSDIHGDAVHNERFMKATISRTPVRRWGQPSEFGDVAVFLADKRQMFHTGDVIVMDGGYTAF